jgi:hypothetical protein
MILHKAAITQAAIAQRTAVADTAYTALTSDSLIVFTSLSAARTVTLPAANTYTPGQPLFIVDGSGSASQTNQISIAPNGADTIAGSNTTQVCVNIPRGRAWLVSNGSNGWDVLVWSVRYYGTLGGNVAINNASGVDVLTITHDNVGTWKASGASYVNDTAASNIVAKIYDGTTSIASGNNPLSAAGSRTIALPPATITNPTGNLRLWVRTFTTTATAYQNNTGAGVDTYLLIERLA